MEARAADSRTRRRQAARTPASAARLLGTRAARRVVVRLWLPLTPLFLLLAPFALLLAPLLYLAPRRSAAGPSPRSSALGDVAAQR